VLVSDLFLQTNANKSKTEKYLLIFYLRCQECGVLVSDLTKHRNLRHDPASKIIISDLEPDVVRQDRWDLETICFRKAVLRIRIHRIRMFLGLPGLDPNPSVIEQKSKKNHVFLLICDFFMTFYLEPDVVRQDR
jgi:hypothetical protein